MFVIIDVVKDCFLLIEYVWGYQSQGVCFWFDDDLVN